MHLPRTVLCAALALNCAALGSVRPAHALLMYSDLPSGPALEQHLEHLQSVQMSLQKGAPIPGEEIYLELPASGLLVLNAPAASDPGAVLPGMSEVRRLSRARNSALGWIPEPTPLLLWELGLLGLALRPARRALARTRGCR